MTMSIRSTIEEIRNELRDTPPADAMACSEYLVKLSAIYGNVNDEIGRTEALHHQNMAQMLDTDPTVGVEKLKIKAQALPAYIDLQTAKRLSELTKELINSLKYRSRALENEWRQSSQQ
jgi:hypothetical protein